MHVNSERNDILGIQPCFHKAGANLRHAVKSYLGHIYSYACMYTAAHNTMIYLFCSEITNPADMCSDKRSCVSVFIVDFQLTRLLETFYILSLSCCLSHAVFFLFTLFYFFCTGRIYQFFLFISVFV